jgi:hypothetical protein
MEAAGSSPGLWVLGGGETCTELGRLNLLLQHLGQFDS